VFRKGQSALYGHGHQRPLDRQLIYHSLQCLHIFLGLLWAKKSCVVLIRFIAGLRPAIELLEELHLHDVARDERRLVILGTQLRPVNAREPRVLLDFADGLGPAGRVLIQQSVEQIDEEDFRCPVAWDSNQSKVRWLL
jgi:hypothetical protein